MKTKKEAQRSKEAGRTAYVSIRLINIHRERATDKSLTSTSSYGKILVKLLLKIVNLIVNLKVIKHHLHVVVNPPLKRKY